MAWCWQAAQARSSSRHSVRDAPSAVNLDGELRMAPTLDGKRMVILGLRTSKMSKRRHGEFTDLAMAFGDQHGVQWSATSLGREWADLAEGVEGLATLL